MKNALIIFVRTPELGKVKTRLAATLGAEKALSIYQDLLHHTLKIAAAADADKFIFYTDENVPEALLMPGSSAQLQRGNDLGEKMSNAFSTVFSAGCECAIIIGSDCPELTSTIINEAFERLRDNDAVIGPSTDGGYYLLGLKTFHPAIFINKQWSTDFVYADTIADFTSLGLSYFKLPMLTDVDTEEDWRRTMKSGGVDRQR